MAFLSSSRLAPTDGAFLLSTLLSQGTPMESAPGATDWAIANVGGRLYYEVTTTHPLSASLSQRED
jgi:hypothetical protein